MALSEHFPLAIEAFSVHLDNEIPCLLTDITVIKDRVIVVDNENKKVKRFTLQKELVDVLCLEDPCGVDKLFLSSHIVVTEPQQRQITFVRTDTNLTISSYRRTVKRYQPICCLDEMRFIVGCCDLGRGSVDILNYEGIVLSSIEFDSQKQRLFRTPASLACFDGNHVIVSDSGHRKLICLNPQGDVKFVHDPKGTPSGVAVNNKGEVYLCMYDTNVVHLLNTHFGTSSDDFVQDLEVKFPLSICVHEKCLFITEEMPSDRVTVINLEACKTANKRPPTIKLSNIRLRIIDEKETSKPEQADVT